MITLFRDPGQEPQVGMPPVEPTPAVEPVNLDNLVEPEGSQMADLTMGLPNFDNNPPSEPPVEPPAGTINLTQQPGTPVTPAEPKTPEPISPYQSIVNKYYAKYGDKFDLNTKDITEENFTERIEEAIFSAKQSELHPEVQKFNKAISQGVKPEEYIQKYSKSLDIESMPSKELVALSLKQSYGKTEQRPNGWDDNKIEDTIKKMETSGLLDIEAEKIKTNYQENRATMAERLANEQRQMRETEERSINTERDRQIKESINYFNTLNDINGLPISQSEREGFVDEFKYLVTPTQETGMSPLAEALQSNENLVKIAWYLKKADSKIRESLSQAKENTKNNFFNKLDPEPKLPKKTGPVQSTGIDLDALVAPATS